MTVHDDPHRAVEVWVNRLDSGGTFTAPERQALEAMLRVQRRFRIDDVLIDQWDTGDFGVLILEGLCARCKQGPDGRRQIVAILTPGDFCSGGLALVMPIDYDLVALTDGKAARISAEHIRRLQSQAPGVMLSLGRSLAEEGVITREWVFNIGARHGEGRVAHLICELVWRLRAVDMLPDEHFLLPLRQQDIADATGLNRTHVNRILKKLEGQGLIKLRIQQVEVLDRAGLAQVARFDPGYLVARQTGPAALAWRGLALDPQRRRRL